STSILKHFVVFLVFVFCLFLDFLPLQCDACKQDFHKDHFTCAAHKCPFAFEKVIDLCPLCNKPVPVKKGEIPDCSCHPRKKEKIFICRRSKEGCKKEMLQVICDQGRGSFRIQRRHPLDHSCPRGNLAVSVAG
uniref:AN1-type domain-containing protein n=1 Tax=Felis catus TaxID=9685 RepID=A0ABI7WA20_FELCA